VYCRMGRIRQCIVSRLGFGSAVSRGRVGFGSTLRHSRVGFGSTASR
jgi:hypothetical protein